MIEISLELYVFCSTEYFILLICNKGWLELKEKGIILGYSNLY